MFGFGFNKTYTGVDIGRSGVTAVRAALARDRWKVLDIKRAPLPAGALACSFRNPNIRDRSALAAALGSVLGPRPGKIGLSLPMETVRVSVQRFEELPDTPGEIDRMLAWSTQRSLHLSAESLRVSHARLGKGDLLVAMGTYDVIGEYEAVVAAAGGQARVVGPGGLNQFNFFSPMVPGGETVAYAGVFENFFTFYVLENGRIVFYQEIKKEIPDESLYEEMDMTIQYYGSEGVGRKIGALYMGSRSPVDLAELGDLLSGLNGIALLPMDESRAAEWRGGVPDDLNGAVLSAVGAAQSLKDREG